MSQKKSKSKSKDKVADKPPKDNKSKKSKQDKDDTKSKKSADKGDKKLSKSQSKKSDLNKSKVEKQSKIDMNQSQQLSFFKPLITQHIFSLDESLCMHHKQKNTIFCQICEQTGCQNCLLYGPHNNQMHRITKIDQAFTARYLFLNELVCGGLIERRDKLNSKLEKLTVLSDQLRYVKNGVEKMTKIQYNQMMDRLKTGAGGKFAILHHQMAQLQKDLQAINALGNQFFQLTNMNPQIQKLPETNPNKGMVPFLLRSRFLQQLAQQLISKPIKTSVDVYPYDLPRQITQKKMILQKNKKWLDLLGVKDQAIWCLVEQKKNLQKKMWTQFQVDAETQIDQWTKLKSKITQQLCGFQIHCKKCKQLFSEQNVNSQCKEGDYHEFDK